MFIVGPTVHEATDGTNLKDEATDGTNLKDEATDGTNLKDEATDGTNKKDESTDGTNLKDEATDGTNLKDVATDGTNLKVEATDGTNLKDEATDGTNLKDEPNKFVGNRDGRLSTSTFQTVYICIDHYCFIASTQVKGLNKSFGRSNCKERCQVKHTFSFTVFGYKMYIQCNIIKLGLHLNAR